MKKLAAPSNSPVPITARATFGDSPIRMRRGLWPLADGYLESNVIGGFLRGLMWFVGLFLAFVLVSGAQKVAQQKMPPSLLVQFIVLQIPRIVVFTIPSALLFGTVSTFTEMSSRGELTALMAGGMSLKRMLRAPLVAALCLSLVAFYLQESVVPRCELKRGEVAVAALQNAKASQIFPIVNNDKETGKVLQVIQADDFDAKTLSLVRPDIRVYSKDGSAWHITAKSARWDKTRSEWVFLSGKIAREPSPDAVATPGQSGFTITPFPEFRTRVALDPSTFNKGTRDLASQLEAHNFEMISLAELKMYRGQLLDRARQTQRENPDSTKKVDFLHSEARAATYGIHDKIATPLIALAMVLIGAPLGVRPQRTASAGLALGLSLMVLLGYYVVWTLVTQWGKGGGGQPLVAAYLPLVVLAGLGAFLTWKKS